MGDFRQIEVCRRDPLKIKLTVKPAPIIIMLSLSIILGLTIFLPLMGIGYALIYGNGPHIGFVFILGLDFIIIRFLVRTILWNLYGSEHLSFKENEFSYQADYRYFKGPLKLLNSNYQPYYYFPEGGDEVASIGVSGDEDNIVGVVKLPIREVKKLWENEIGILENYSAHGKQ